MADLTLAPLMKWTSARIGLGRAGAAIGTNELLEFRAACARARDAVHAPWDVRAFQSGLTSRGLETVVLATRARSREEFLLRPDLGRRLHPECAESLKGLAKGKAEVALAVSDGLSATALECHGLALVEAIRKELLANGLRLAPIALVPFGRVAVSDEIGSNLGARISVIVIGERPGLSAADSLGLYLTYDPQLGTSDARRNCISNIRPPEGLSYEAAAKTLAYLVTESLRRGQSGVELKIERESSLTMPPGFSFARLRGEGE